MSDVRLWQTGWVVEDPAGRRWVEFDDPTRCRRCREGQGCGAAQWGRLFGAARTHRLPLSDEDRWPVGTRVRAGLPARALLGLAVRAYGIPLLALVLLVVIADAAGAPEAVSLAAGLAAAVAAWGLLRFATPRGLQPLIEAADAPCPAARSNLESAEH